MRASPACRPEGRAAHSAVIACMLLLGWGSAAAAGIAVTAASGRVVNDLYTVDADVSYDFGEETLRALRSGVPITIELEVRVDRERPWLWDETIASVRQHYRVEQHALSRQFVVTNLVTGARRSFPGLQSALVGLGEVSGVPVIEAERLRGVRHRTSVRARLDLEALPAPLQLGAWLSLDWHLHSDWFSFQVQS